MADLLGGHLKALKQLIGPLEKATKLKETDPGYVSELVSLSRKFPKGDQLDDLTGKIGKELVAESSRRQGDFQRAIATFINSKKKVGASVRESGEGWRVDSLTLAIDVDRVQVKALYNKEILLDARIIQSESDIDAYVKEASEKLRDAILDDGQVLFEAAIKRCAAFRGAQRIENPSRVPLMEVYTEVAAEIVRRSYANKRTQTKPLVFDFPLWSFLYNLDVLLASSRDYASQRFELDTGSQAEHAKKMAVVLYGLDANTDQKQYCYIKLRD